PAHAAARTGSAPQRPALRIRRTQGFSPRRRRLVRRQARRGTVDASGRRPTDAHARRGPTRGCPLMIHSIQAAMLGVMLAIAGAARASDPPPYSAADFTQVRKFDAHVHVNTADGEFLSVAAKD